MRQEVRQFAYPRPIERDERFLEAPGTLCVRPDARVVSITLGGGVQVRCGIRDMATVGRAALFALRRASTWVEMNRSSGSLSPHAPGDVPIPPIYQVDEPMRAQA